MSWDQLVPFQCSTWLRMAPLVAEVKLPTVQQLVFDVQNTPLRLLPVPGMGTAWPPGARAMAGVPPAGTLTAISSAPSSASAPRRRLRVMFTAHAS